jgi:hypothetical protein
MTPGPSRLAARAALAPREARAFSFKYNILQQEKQEVSMNRFNKFLVAAFMSAAMLLPGMVQAMDINDYFKMADQDQGRFAQSLLTGAEKLLNDEGRVDLANQLDTLFTEVKPGNKLSDGMADYEARLGAMLGAEVNREVRNPNLPHLQAERAFRDAAKDHGIPLPPAFDTVASDFHPQFPPKDAKKKDDKKKN